MIVDLVRNDLGRVAEIGTVRASALLDVRPHPGVWHLVSSVEAQLRPDVTDADLLRAAFPPGSVTGAPKVRAMAAIAELEPTPRGTYTGAIGFSSPLWGAEFAVAIRTFEIADGRIELGVGGGITADSVPMLEWQECGHKAAPLLAAAGAVRDPRRRRPGGPEAARRRPARDRAGARRRRAPAARPPGPARPFVPRAVRPGSCPATWPRASRRRPRRCPGPRRAARDRAAGAAGGRHRRPRSARPRARRVVSVGRPAGLWRHKWADRDVGRGRRATRCSSARTARCWRPTAATSSSSSRTGRW